MCPDGKDVGWSAVDIVTGVVDELIVESEPRRLSQRVIRNRPWNRWSRTQRVDACMIPTFSWQDVACAEVGGLLYGYERPGG
jgi:hypothetical protein